MIIDSPRKEQLPALRGLWKEAFGDTDEFLDAFEKTAFSPDRCRCITTDGETAAALYWFNCEYNGKKIAYLYAVATAEKYRGQGLCHKLMDNTHEHLRSLGYIGVILVPGSAELFRFYEKMEYRTCSTIGTFSCTAKEDITEVHKIDCIEYALLRRTLLPEGGVIQENENIAFLNKQAVFYAGKGFLLAARDNGDTLYGLELLGDKDMAPSILKSLGYSKGNFRIPGTDLPFAMYYSLENTQTVPPAYFGLAFD